MPFDAPESRAAPSIPDVRVVVVLLSVRACSQREVIVRVHEARQHRRPRDSITWAPAGTVTFGRRPGSRALDQDDLVRQQRVRPRDPPDAGANRRERRRQRGLCGQRRASHANRHSA